MDTIQLENEILSAREFEVLELIARGHKNREIALALGIEERTVRFHVGLHVKICKQNLALSQK